MWKVYVGNLDSRVKERELADEFRSYGNVRSVWVARNPPGYAFVEFDDRRDAEDAVSALDGRHGWRVEMSRKSIGGRSRGTQGNESKCYDCGAPGHFARECRTRGSRHSYRRSPSPISRTDGHRHGPTRSGRDVNKSPRHDRFSSYRDSPRRKRERSRSLESDKSEDRGRRRKVHKSSVSPPRGNSEILSLQREDNEISRSPQNDPQRENHELSRSPQHVASQTRETSPQIKESKSSKSPLNERSGDERDPKKEVHEHSSPLQGEESDVEGNRFPVPQEHSSSPQVDNVGSYRDGCSPSRNGNASSRSQQEENGAYADRSAEELLEQENGESD